MSTPSPAEAPRTAAGRSDVGGLVPRQRAAPPIERVARLRGRREGSHRGWLWLVVAVLAVANGYVEARYAAEPTSAADTRSAPGAGVVAFGGQSPLLRPVSAPTSSVPAGSVPVSSMPAQPAALPSVPDVRVRYEIVGPTSAWVLSYTTGRARPVSELTRVRLPWQREFDALGGFVPSVSAQGVGPITCRITVNGVELSSVTTLGANAVATCTGHALD